MIRRRQECRDSRLYVEALRPDPGSVFTMGFPRRSPRRSTGICARCVKEGPSTQDRRELMDPRCSLLTTHEVFTTLSQQRAHPVLISRPERDARTWRLRFTMESPCAQPLHRPPSFHAPAVLSVVSAFISRVFCHSFASLFQICPAFIFLTRQFTRDPSPPALHQGLITCYQP